MSKKQTLVNNGLPEGLHFKDLKEGDVVLVKWRDAAPSHHIVTEAHDGHRPKTYKGHVSFRMLGLSQTVEGDQIIRKVDTVSGICEALDVGLSDDALLIRAE